MPVEFIAFLAPVSYALVTVCGWFGLTYASALVATLGALASRSIMLWMAVVFTGGIPQFAPQALWVFVGLGVLQSATSLLTFVGLQKIGTARSQPLRNTYPLWSSSIAISLMHEQAGPPVLGGTILVVLGVPLITWQPDTRAIAYCWWHVLYSLGAGILAGVAFPIRRYGLTITNEPGVLCRPRRSRVVGVLAAVCLDIAPQSKYRLAPKSFDAFLGVRFLRGVGRAVEPDGSRCRYRGGGFTDRCDRTAVESTDCLYVPARDEKAQRPDRAGYHCRVRGTIAITLGR
jgi:uncharacterized membrane protein